MAAGLAAQLTATRDAHVAQLDASVKEVTGDPAALRTAKDAVAREATTAHTTGTQAGQESDAAQKGWQGGAYESMRARVQGTTDEYTDSSTVLTKAADGFERAATALEKAKGDLDKVRQDFTGRADSLIQQAQQVPPEQEATAGRALAKNLDAQGRQARAKADAVLRQFDGEMSSVAAGAAPGKTAKVGRHNGTGYVVYPDGEARVGGDRAWRNNNPGNMVYGPRAARFGAFGTDGYGRKDPFAVFPDQAAGDAAMRDLMLQKHGDKTFAEAVPSYAPAFENNVPGYLNAVGQNSGLDVTTRTIGSYTPAEFDRLIGAMRQHERGRAGDIYTRDNAPSWLLPLFGP